jgi:hypothetical protein
LSEPSFTYRTWVLSLINNKIWIFTYLWPFLYTEKAENMRTTINFSLSNNQILTDWAILQFAFLSSLPFALTSNFICCSFHYIWIINLRFSLSVATIRNCLIYHIIRFWFFVLVLSVVSLLLVLLHFKIKNIICQSNNDI